MPEFFLSDLGSTPLKFHKNKNGIYGEQYASYSICVYKKHEGLWCTNSKAGQSGWQPIYGKAYDDFKPYDTLRVDLLPGY